MTADRISFPKDSAERATHVRLLESAGQVFADKGFKNATVREICQKAGANVAAINYHFGDKEKLYTEVLRFAHQCAIAHHPPGAAGGEESSAEERLRGFISSFLRRMFDDGRPAWHAKLMSREIAEPTAALARLVKQDLCPLRDRLTLILRDIIGSNADDLLLQHCVMSIVGQCLSFFHGRPVIERLFPTQKYDAQGIGERAEYIYRFSLAALRRLSEENEMPSRNAKPRKARTA